MAYLQGYAEEGDWIISRFHTQWQTAQSFTDGQMQERVAWPNVEFTPPTDASGNPLSWVRISIQHSGAEQASIDPTPIHRHDGMVVIEVFTPQDGGDGDMDDLCDTAAGIYRNNTTQQGLRFRTPRVITVGADGGWYRKNVLCPFVRDTVFS